MHAVPFRQSVPRPRSFEPGPPPPWAALSPEQRAAVSVDGLVAALEAFPQAVGDPPAGSAEAPDPTEALGPVEPSAPAGITAAVLVPVFAAYPGGAASVVLIRRAADLQRDPGHVAFPGGFVEPGEAPLDAALREAEEEIGLPQSAVEVRGLVDLVGRRSGEQVAAYLGVLDGPPALFPSASEVDCVLQVPVAALLADGVAWQERWMVAGSERPVCFFADHGSLGDDLVWGLSARILWRLLERVAQVA